MIPPRLPLLLALILLLYFSASIVGQEVTHDPRSGYVGDASCTSCHNPQSSTYLHTSHHLTSQPVNKSTVLGSFAEGSNVLMIVDPTHATAEPGLYFRMTQKDGSFYQTA